MGDFENIKANNQALSLLIIEDDEDLRDLLEIMLERENFKITLKANGKEGLKEFKVTYSQIDVVILDLSLPDLAGIEVFQKLNEIDPNVKIIISTGLSERKIDKTILANSTGILKKPYDIILLGHTIRKIFQKSITTS
ncbi:MAG: response regulator [Candidatus Hodarchaeales archaeon]|jgi:DNA-binding response OmpR family regulator